MPKKKSVISKSAKAVMTGVIVGSLGVGGAVAGVGSINQHSISPTIENAYGAEVERSSENMSVEDAIQKYGEFEDEAVELNGDQIKQKKLSWSRLCNISRILDQFSGDEHICIAAKPGTYVTAEFIKTTRLPYPVGAEEKIISKSAFVNSNGFATFNLGRAGNFVDYKIKKAEGKFAKEKTAKQIFAINNPRTSNIFSIGYYAGNNQCDFSVSFSDNKYSTAILFAYLDTLHNTVFELKGLNDLQMKKIAPYIINKNNVVVYHSPILPKSTVEKIFGKTQVKDMVVVKDKYNRNILNHFTLPSVIQASVNSDVSDNIDRFVKNLIKGLYHDERTDWFKMPTEKISNDGKQFYYEVDTADYKNKYGPDAFTFSGGVIDNLASHIVGLYNMDTVLDGGLSDFGKKVAPFVADFINDNFGTSSSENLLKGVGGQDFNNLENFLAGYELTIGGKILEARNNNIISESVSTKYMSSLYSVTADEDFVYKDLSSHPLANYITSKVDKNGHHLPLNRFTVESVEKLDVNNCSDFYGIERFTGLKELIIKNSNIHANEFKNIKNLQNLSAVNIQNESSGNTTIVDANLLLKYLPKSIGYLMLSNCNISDISPLRDFSKLKKIFLDNNNISDIAPLQFIDPETIDLSRNNIKYFPEFFRSSIRSLKNADLSNNHIFPFENTNFSINKSFDISGQTATMVSTTPKLLLNLQGLSVDENQRFGVYNKLNSEYTLTKIPTPTESKYKENISFEKKQNYNPMTVGTPRVTYSGTLTIDFTDYVNSLIKKVQNAQGDNTAKQKIIDKINQGDVSIEEIENDIKQLHQATPVQFKDKVLEEAIKNALSEKGLKFNEDQITNIDCENLTELSIGFPETGIGGKLQQITNLSDLQYLKNLKKITIANGHAISDLSPLAQCPRLETINIAGVSNPDVTPLKALTKLKSVSLPDQNYRLTSSKDTVPLNFLHHLSDITLVSNDGNPAYGSIQGNDFILGTFPANNVVRINFKCEKSSIDGVPIGTYTGTISIDYSEYRKKIEEMIKLLDEKKAKEIQGKINSGTMSIVELHKDLESVENAPVFTEKQLYKILARALGKEEGYIVKKEDLDKIQSIKLTKEEFEAMEFLKDDFHQLKNLKSIDASNLGAETFNKIEYRLGTKLVKDKIKPAPLEKFSADNNHIFSIDKLSNSVITFHGQTFTNTATGRVVNISQLKYNTGYRPWEHGIKNNDKYTGLISSSLGEAFTQGQEKYGYKFIEKNFTGNVRLDKIPTKPQIDISVSNPRYNFDGVYTVDFAPYIQSLKDKVADSTAGEEEKDLVLKMINTAGTSIDDIEMAILRLGKTTPSETQTEDISGELQKLLDSYNSVKATDNYKNADDNLKQTYDTAITEGQKVYDKLSSTPEQVKQAQQTIQSALEALNGDKKAQAIKEQLNTTTQQVSSLQEQLEKAKQQGTADKSKIEQLSGQISTLNSQLEQLKTDNSKSIEQKQQEIAKLNGQIADLNKQVAQLTQDKQSLQSQLDTATSKVQNLTGELENAKRQGVVDKATIERINGELQQAKQQLEQLKQDKTKSDEEKQKEINQLNTKITELGKQITQLTQEKSSLTEQLQTAQQSISTLQDKLQKATEQGTADKSKIEQLNGQVSTLNSQLEKIKSDKTLSEQQKQAEIDKLNGQITELGKQISQLTAEKQSLQQQLDKATGSVQNLTSELEIAKRQGVADKATIERINGELQQTKQQLEQLKQDKTKSDEQKQKEIEQLNAKIGELGQQITQLNKDKENLTQQLQTAQQSLSDTQQKLKKAEEKGTTDSQTISGLNEKIKTLSSQLEQLKQDNTKSIGEKQKEIEKLNGQIEDLNKQVSQLTQDKKTLSEQLQQTQSNLADVQKKLQTATEQGVADKATIEQLNGQISTLNSQLEKLKSDKTLSEQQKQAEIDKLNG